MIKVGDGGGCNYMYLTFYYSYLKKVWNINFLTSLLDVYVAHFSISVICDESINEILTVTVFKCC